MAVFGPDILQVAFGVLWAASCVLDDAYLLHHTTSSLVVTEAVKLLIGIVSYVRLSRNTRHQSAYQELPLDESDGRDGSLSGMEQASAARPTIRNRKWTMIYAFIVASLSVSRNLMVSISSSR